MIYLIFILFLVAWLKNGFFWLALWQIKEYRLDRFLYYLRTPEGFVSFFNKSFVLQFIGLYLVLNWDIADPSSVVSVVLLVLACDGLLSVFQFGKKSLLKPNFTSKAKLIFLVFSAISLGWVFWSYGLFTITLWHVHLLALVLISPALLSLSILLVYPLSFYLKSKALRQVAEKIKQSGRLKVVGITGSYGKTSVKEFVSRVLESHYKILKTLGNNNSEMGVAQTVLKNDFAGVEYFVAEMGAYKKGEIAKICQMVNPEISILTGIDQQHSVLFGGLANTIKAKSEIIWHTKPGGTIILNYDNEHVRKIVLPDNLKKISYAINWTQADLKAFDIKTNANGQQAFKVSYLAAPAVVFTTDLLGEHNILNLLAAMAAALTAGLKLEDLPKIVAAINPPSKTMQKIQFKNSILINDSYNANPSGVLSALDVLENFAGKKILLLDDILELGRDTLAINKKVAQKISELNLEKIILVGKNFSWQMFKLLSELKVEASKIMRGQGSGAVNAYLENEIKNMPVILFEGRQTEKNLNKILQNK